MDPAGITSLFCFGLGYSARVLARALLAEGVPVAGTVRSAERARALADEGIAGFAFDGAAIDPALEAALGAASHVLSSVPPQADGDPVLHAFGDRLRRQAPRYRWVGYLSTTGVYGDRAGGWVDETSPLAPTGPRGARRVAAETGWLGLQSDAHLPVHVFRLAGIYGPGRNQLRAVLDGTAKRIDKPGQVFSRIHVDDIAAVLRASMARPEPGRIYNVCDDEPASPARVTAYAAQLLGRAPPPLQSLEAARLSEMGQSFYADSKRVRNERIKRELGVRLRYPSYREGLAALIDGERAAPSVP